MRDEDRMSTTDYQVLYEELKEELTTEIDGFTLWADDHQTQAFIQNLRRILAKYEKRKNVNYNDNHFKKHADKIDQEEEPPTQFEEEEEEEGNLRIDEPEEVEPDIKDVLLRLGLNISVGVDKSSSKKRALEQDEDDEDKENQPQKKLKGDDSIEFNSCDPVLKAFGISLILEKIMRKLNSNDLLSARLVSRNWCESATDILQHRDDVQISLHYLSATSNFAMNRVTLYTVDELSEVMSGADNFPFPCVNFRLVGDLNSEYLQEFLFVFGERIKRLELVNPKSFHHFRRLLMNQVPNLEYLSVRLENNSWKKLPEKLFPPKVETPTKKLKRKVARLESSSEEEDEYEKEREEEEKEEENEKSFDEDAKFSDDDDDGQKSCDKDEKEEKNCNEDAKFSDDDDDGQKSCDKDEKEEKNCNEDAKFSDDDDDGQKSCDTENDETPQLHRLTQLEFFPMEKKYWPLVQEILQAAPNLVTCNGGWETCADVVDFFISSNRALCLNHLNLNPSEDDLSLITEFVEENNLLLKTLELNYSYFKYEEDEGDDKRLVKKNVGKLGEILSNILDSSQKTLEVLKLTPSRQFSDKIVWPSSFDKLWKLELTLQQLFTPRGFSLEFSTRFPALHTVTINAQAVAEDEYFIHENFKRNSLPFQDEAPGVKWLNIYGDLPALWMAKLTHIFPNVRHLSLLQIKNFPQFGQLVWKFSELKSLELDLESTEANKSYAVDAVFTGLEEGTCIFLQNDGRKIQLENFQLKELRVNPSVLDLEKLEQVNIKIRIYDDGEPDDDNFSCSNQAMSVLSGIYGFWMKPGLKNVELSLVPDDTVFIQDCKLSYSEQLKDFQSRFRTMHLYGIHLLPSK